MPSRSVRRRKHKQLQRARTAGCEQRRREAARRLVAWTTEAYRRASDLQGPGTWRLAADPHVRAVARALDPGGELLGDLEYTCAEAVARRLGGPRAAGGGRPRIERARP